MPWSGTTSACYQRCSRRFPGGTKIAETTQQRRTVYNTTKRDQFSELLLLQRPLFQNNLGKPTPDLNDTRDNGVWGWQWHQLDHMQTICTSLQTDNHSNTSALNSIKVLKAARTS